MEVRELHQGFRGKGPIGWDAKSIIVAVSLTAEALAMVLFTIGHFVKP